MSTNPPNNITLSPASTCDQFNQFSANKSYVYSEFKALESLYISTNGMNWINKDGWNFTSYHDPCYEHWYGIKCTFTCDDQVKSCACSVTEVRLMSNNLIGTLPSTIQNLKRLQILSLNSNRLVNYIPTSIGYLTRLRSLALNSNQLTGPIPTEIGLLTQLSSLDLSANNFQGPIPTTIGSLVALEVLLIQDNQQLGGKIPSEIGYLTKLRDFECYNNNITGNIPTTIGNLGLLNFIYLHTNNINGTIPTEIGNLRDLWFLGLYSNYITGYIPTEIGRCTTLYDIDFYDNQLSGPVPSELGNLAYLTVLILNYNMLSGEIPTTILKPTIQSLYLSNNRINGSIPTSIGKARNLRSLVLASNNLNSIVPTEIGLLTCILNLDLADNLLSGELPSVIFTLNSLQVLDLSSNKFNSSIPTNISQIKMLTYLSLYQNELTGHLPTELCELKNLQVLVLFDNALSGQIPTEIAFLTAMSSLSVGSNLFSGSITLELYELQNLTSVDLSNNLFSGHSGLDSIGDLINLQSFSVSSNKLSGFLPTSVGELHKLQSFIISYNNFIGKLPTQLYQLSNLTTIDVSNNRLTGQLNYAISPFANISYAEFSNNRFTGILSNNLFNPFIASFSAAVNCLNGQLPTTLCDSALLQYLNVDGMSSACRHISDPNPPIPFPECVFNLKSLRILHMSGNQLSGRLKISSNASLPVSLVEIDLSHNTLRGEIPIQIYKQKWNKINLGFNKLGGTLSPDIAMTDIAINLAVNRLSGPIPLSYQNISTISILNQNLFDCSVSRNTLPRGDSSSSYYECGTQGTNISFVVVLCILLFSGGLLVYLYRVAKPRPSGLNYLLKTGHIITASLCMSVLCACGVAVSFGLHQYYSMYSYMYAWGVGFGFLSGVVVGTVLIALAVISSAVIYLFYSQQQLKEEDYDVQIDASQEHGLETSVAEDNFVSNGFVERNVSTINGESSYMRNFSTATLNRDDSNPKNRPYNTQRDVALALLLYYVASGCFTVTLNIIYVLNVNRLTGFEIFAVQLGFACFKASYQWLPVRLNNLFGENSMYNGCYKYRHIWRKIAGNDNRLALNLFSIIIAPCLATSVANTNCFYYLVFSYDVVRSTYEKITVDYFSYVNRFRLYKSYNDNGVNNFIFDSRAIIVDTSYYPTFSYSYQCASSLMATYVSVFIYFVMIGGIATPMFRLFFRWFQVSLNSKLEKESGSLTTLYKNICARSNKFLPNVLTHCNIPTTDAKIYQFCDYETAVKRSFRHEDILSQLWIMTVIGVTFGLIYAPLGAILFISIVFYCYLTNAEIEYFVANAHPTIKDDVVRCIRNSFLPKKSKVKKLATVYSKFLNDQKAVLLTTLASVFIWCFLFDTLGDTLGFLTALWSSLIAIAPLPLSVFLLTYLKPKCPSKNFNDTLDHNCANTRPHSHHSGYYYQDQNLKESLNPMHKDQL